MLAGDTFAHGRLTNPALPFAEHFETFHVLQRPTYSSKYPPAQGLTLALGQVLVGKPIVGVWISTALLSLALTWMLRGWFRTRWALWGSALVTLMLASTSDGYWLATYWGGTVAAIGAALLYGAARRIPHLPSPLNAVLFALGLGLLALSRPFEGALVALPAVGVVTYWLLRNTRTAPGIKLRGVVLPFAVVSLALATFAMLHNLRVTGNALRPPYAEYEAQYSTVPLFLFSKSPSRTPQYSNDEMRRFYAEQKSARDEVVRSPRSQFRGEYQRVIELKRFLAPGLTLILLFVVVTSWLTLRSLALPVAGSALVLLGALTVSWFFPHYIAPIIAPWAILLTAGARRLARLQSTQARTGELLAWFVFAITAFAAITTSYRLRAEQPMRRNGWAAKQDSIGRSLAAGGTKHLILVSYGSTHDVDNEWVYNVALLDQSPVIWARSLTPAQNAQLMAHFPERAVWDLQVDSGGVPFRLTTVSRSTTSEQGKQ